MRRLATGLWFAFAGLQLPSCQFPSYNLPAGAGGAPAAGSSGSSSTAGAAAGMGGASEPLCQDDLSCRPLAPAGWRGPVAYWQGASTDELPDCPDGYAEPTDLSANLRFDPATCTCTCTAKDLTCRGANNVVVYGNLNCDDACFTPSAMTCTPFSGCSGAALSIEGVLTEPAGRCVVDVQRKLTPARWQSAARFCEAEGEAEACGGGQACFPTPTGQFTSQLCVYRVVLAGRAAPECPEEYPSGPQLLYSDFEDERACGECECEGPMGGSCGGKVTIASNKDCAPATEEYEIGSGCLIIRDQSHLSITPEMKPGSCGVASEPEPIGEVVPSGNYYAVCCQ